MARWILLALLIWNSPLIAAQASANQDIHQLRTAGFTATSNLLVYFNFGYGSALEPSNQTAYREAISRLRSGVESLGALEQKKVTDIEGWVRDLELHAREPNYPFSIKLNLILENHSQLDALLEERYRNASLEIPVAQSQLNSLSLDASRMELLYLTFTFRTLIVYIMDSDDAAVASLDQRLMTGFEQLAQQHPELAKKVEKSRLNYVFVRDRMSGLNKKWLPNSVEYYMHRAVLLLDQTALEAS